MSNNEFEDVQKKDVKNSKGFYFFILAWQVWACVWLLRGGAEDGAWVMFGVGIVLMLFNALMNWLTRKKK